jgi:hypothetical protein
MSFSFGKSVQQDEKEQATKQVLESRFRHLLAGFPAYQQATNLGKPGSTHL